MQQTLRPISVLTSTWSRETHGLFDYENSDTTRSLLNISGPGRVVRTENKCLFVREDAEQPLTQDGKVLAKIELDKEIFVVTSEDEPHWIVVAGRSGYKLSEGDTIKLGRVKLTVKETNIPAQIAALHTNQSLEQRQASIGSPGKADLSQSMLTAQYACRICLTETYTKANPLMTPCKCAGTMRYIHLECLQQWLGSKMTMRQSGSALSYSWKNLECELCKEPFPLVASLDGRLVELVQMHKPETPYLMLEDARIERGRGLHVISLLEGSAIHLGRGHESDLRISDISVSRDHASIQLSRDGFFLSDNRSKFGTLLLARRPIRLSEAFPTLIQVDRTVLNFHQRQSWGLVRSCFKRICCCGRSAQIRSESIEPSNPLSEGESQAAAVIEVAEAVGPLAGVGRFSEGLLGDTEHIDEVAESGDRNPFVSADIREDLDTRAQHRNQTDEL